MDTDGFVVCQHIREITDVPIIMLTSLSRDEVVVKGLAWCRRLRIEAGLPRLLLARVRVVLNRARSPVTTNNYLVYEDGLLPISFPFYSK